MEQKCTECSQYLDSWKAAVSDTSLFTEKVDVLATGGSENVLPVTQNIILKLYFFLKMPQLLYTLFSIFNSLKYQMFHIIAQSVT